MGQLPARRKRPNRGRPHCRRHRFLTGDDGQD